MDAFTTAYVACALWSSTDDGGEPLDGGWHELSNETQTAMIADCADFQEAQAADLDLSYHHETIGYDESRAGHDFWLTRNGHGAGFWDRGLGDVGKRLTDAAHVYGGIDLYIGDDEKIYA